MTGPILDQGVEGACVGFGWAAEAFAQPIRVQPERMKKPVPTDPEAFARYIYKQAQKVDEWGGEEYEGTSVLAGAKVMNGLGLLKEYRWAFSIVDIVDAILLKGPVVLGMWWFEDMYEAPNGVLKPGGQIVGGHCLTAVGFRVQSPKLNGANSVVLQNSWGKEWGIGGLAEISVGDLAWLLSNEGEACVPSKRSYGRMPPQLVR